MYVSVDKKKNQLSIKYEIKMVRMNFISGVYSNYFYSLVYKLKQIRYNAVKRLLLEILFNSFTATQILWTLSIS